MIESHAQRVQDGLFAFEAVPSPTWGTLLLSSFLVLFLLRDLHAAIPLPRRIWSVQDAFLSPFRPFIKSEDVLEPTSSKFVASAAKTRLLSCLACIASVAWLGQLIYGVVVTEPALVCPAILQLVAWVRSSSHLSELQVT